MKPDPLQDAVYQAPATTGAAAKRTNAPGVKPADPTWFYATIAVSVLFVLALAYAFFESIRSNNNALAYAQTLSAYVQVVREPKILQAAQAASADKQGDPLRVLAKPGDDQGVPPEVSWAAVQGMREFPLREQPSKPVP